MSGPETVAHFENLIDEAYEATTTATKTKAATNVDRLEEIRSLMIDKFFFENFPTCPLPTSTFTSSALA